MPITLGYYNHISGSIKSSLKKSLENGFDFIVSPLIHTKCSEFIPFSDVFLNGADRSKLVIYIPKRNYQFRKNIHLLEKELTYAEHIGIFNIIIDCPDDFRSIENMAVTINRKLTPDSLDNHMSISIKIEMIPNQIQSNELRKEPEKIDPDYSWLKWNCIRRILQCHRNLSIALELNGELADEERLNRWLGEPIMFIFLPTSIFLTNSSNYPVLSKAIQLFLGQVNFKMARSLSFVIKGNNLHGHLKHYVQYVNYLKETDIFVDKLVKFCRDYEDVLQIPLQPLKDDLDSSIYEVFETDVIKYQQYEKAILEAFKQIQKDVIVVMVVGAGRGPLVDKSLKAASKSNKFIKLFAVEKNPNAIITLKLLKDLNWGGQKGLSCGVVEIISTDMREWNAPEKADLIVSELLGSFGDNELSPECLDGVWNYVHSDTISIPQSYTSYLCPVQSHRIYSQLAMEKRPNINAYEYGYVVHVRNAYLISNPKPVFTFSHVDLEKHPSNRDNSRLKYLTFKSKIKTMCHGFIGYFDCCLFDNIRLSIVPSNQSSDMYSWFPIYFPIQTPFDMNEDESIEIQITRNVNDLHVWYEWTVLRPIQSKVHNLNGKFYSISLH